MPVTDAPPAGPPAADGAPGVGVPVTLIGHPFLSVGRGEHLRAIRRALAAAGVAPKVYDLIRRSVRQEPATADLEASVVESVGAGIRIFHCNGDELEHGLTLLDERQPGIFGQGYNIVFPAWELPIFPADWARQVDRFDEVWSASDFVDAALRAAVSIPVVHIPNACAPHVGQDLGRDHFGLPADDFVILFFFDTFSYTERKNPWAVIRVFREIVAARPDRALHLVIKINHGAHFPAIVRRIEAELGTLVARTTIIDRTIDDNAAKNLIRCCDCFLSLHRSEGFGRGPAEAMFFGKPAVATGWSGNMEYMTERVSFPIGFDLVPVREGEYPRWENQVWAEPRVAEAVAAIIGLVEDPRSGRVIGRRARAHMRRHYADAVLGRRYVSRFAEIVAAGLVPAGAEMSDGGTPTG